MDAILGFLQNPAVLTVAGILAGLLIKYWPPAAKIPNLLIPYLTAIVAFLVKVFGPAEAHAAGLIGGAVGGVLGSALGAGWQAILNSLIYEVFLRHPLAAAGVKKAIPVAVVKASA